MSLQALVDELASGRLDSQQSAKRRETMIQAMALLDASDGATVLAEMEGKHKACGHLCLLFVAQLTESLASVVILKSQNVVPVSLPIG
jgi:hypothetical protein